MEQKHDFLEGDHSFKNWFKIMWKNGYIFIFLVGLSAITAQFIKWNAMIGMVNDNFNDSTFGGIACVIAMLIPWAVTGVVSYKGFYQFWNNLKNGRSQ